MIVNNSVFLFIIIMFSFYTFGDSQASNMEMTFYNTITNNILRRRVDGVYYYKDGDTLSVSCSHTEYNNWLPIYTAIHLYHCKNGTWSYGYLTGCGPTKYYVESNFYRISATFELGKHNDNDAIICEYVNYYAMLGRLSTKIVLMPDAPPTILVNDLHFNKSSSTPNIYEGTRGEYVRFNCQNNENRGTLHWVYCKILTQGNSCRTQVENKKKIYADLTLDQKLNGTEIKCVFTVNQRKTVTSVLFNIRPGKIVGSSQNNMTEMLNNSQQNKDSIASRYYIWVIVGVGVLIMIILMIIIINVYKSKKSGQEGGQENLTYENLSCMVPPFPNSAILEEIYLVPSDRRDVIPRATDNDVTHVLPYIETNTKNLYSKPLPKSIRNQPQNPEISKINIKPNEPTYAELYILSNNDNKQIGNKIEYATVKGMNPNYANVFVDETYVNGKGEIEKDYEDPNYCKVEKLIKDSS